jgi:hypothetical protein
LFTIRVNLESPLQGKRSSFQFLNPELNGQWNTKHGMRNDDVINLYFKVPYCLMEGTCDHCGSKNVQLQEKKIENQIKHVCNECA